MPELYMYHFQHILLYMYLHIQMYAKYNTPLEIYTHVYISNLYKTYCVGDKVAGSHTSPQPDHSQSKPMPHRQQQHPLQIVHKMPLKAAAGKESPHSHHTPASTAGQHVGNHSKEIYRNQRVRKLPPGNNKGAGIFHSVCVHVCKCI